MFPFHLFWPPDAGIRTSWSSATWWRTTSSRSRPSAATRSTQSFRTSSSRKVSLNFRTKISTKDRSVCVRTLKNASTYWNKRHILKNASTVLTSPHLDVLRVTFVPDYWSLLIVPGNTVFGKYRFYLSGLTPNKFRLADFQVFPSTLSSRRGKKLKLNSGTLAPQGIILISRL